MPLRPLIASLAGLLVAACGGAATPAADAGPDATGDEPVAPAPPTVGPCAAGWREVEAEPGLVVCDPWPASGHRADCPLGQAHFAGTPDCARVGTACDASGWPTDLPAGRPVVYVDDDAAPGGDGASRATALGSITAALAAAPADAVIALARGRYDEDVVIDAGVTLWGACPEGTVLTSSRTSLVDYAVVLGGVGAGLRNLAFVDSARQAVVVRAAGTTIEQVVADRVTLEVLFVESGDVRVDGMAIRDTALDGNGRFGRGVDLDRGAHARLERVVIDGSHDFAVALTIGARLEATGLAVEGTLPRGDGLGGVGVYAAGAGTSVHLAAAAIEHSRYIGIYLREGATLDATDLVVRDTATGRSAVHGDGVLGEGIRAEAGGGATIARAWIERSHDLGIMIAGPTTLEARDVVVRETAGREAGLLGRGIGIQDGASAVLERVRIADSREAGLYVNAATRVSASDIDVSDTRANGAGLYGFGLWAEHAQVTLARVRIARSLVSGLGLGQLAAVDATDLSVEASAPGCFVTGCTEPVGGFGVSAHFGATLTVTGFAIRDSALCGVVIGMDAPTGATGLDLTRGAVERAPVGACLQVPDYDTRRLQHEVVWRDVGLTLQATSYALPDALTSP